MLVLSAADVERLLDLDRLVDAVATAMADLSAGRAVMPARVAIDVADRDGRLLAMPAFLPGAAALVTKLVSLFPHNTDRPVIQAVICCFDPRTGTPVAVIDGRTITAARTAAGSVLASRLLARPGSRIVSIIGTGVQARSHARAMARRPGIDVIQIAGRDVERAAALVDDLTGGGIPAVVVNSFEQAVRSADIVCATTHAAEPVIRRTWLRPGTHVNSVGYNPAGAGEVDEGTIAEALVVVESRSVALAEAVELHRAAQIHAELGELVAGTRPGRSDEHEITVYKSVGSAVQDAAAAALVLESALDVHGRQA